MTGKTHFINCANDECEEHGSGTLAEMEKSGWSFEGPLSGPTGYCPKCTQDLNDLYLDDSDEYTSDRDDGYISDRERI